MQVAPSRWVVQAFRDAGGLDHAQLEEAGHKLAELLATTDLPGSLLAYNGLGLGELAAVFATKERFEFSGHGLLACPLALGYLRGAVERLTGTRAVGAQVRCTGRGADHCVFVVMPKPVGREG